MVLVNLLVSLLKNLLKAQMCMNTSNSDMLSINCKQGLSQVWTTKELIRLQLYFKNVTTLLTYKLRYRWQILSDTSNTEIVRVVLRCQQS